MAGMPWFRHSANLRNQSHCVEALCQPKEGLRLYAFWVILHEIYAQEWKGSGKELEISLNFLRKESHINQKTCELFLKFFENQGVLGYRVQGDRVFITIPNFLEIAAEYQKKKLRKQLEDDRSITGQYPSEKKIFPSERKKQTPAVGSAVSEEPPTEPPSNHDPQPDTKTRLIKGEKEDTPPQEENRTNYDNYTPKERPQPPNPQMQDWLRRNGLLREEKIRL